MAWEIVELNGVQYRRSEGFALVPVDGSKGVAIVYLNDDGLTLSGVSAVAQGAPGVHAEIDSTIVLTELANGDATPASATWTTLVPPSGSTAGVYRLNIALHKGADGTDGASVLNPASFGTPVAGRLIVVNDDLDGFEFAPQRVGDRYYPASVNASGSGDANTTLCPIPLPSMPFDYRVEVEGQTIVDGANVLVDFVARLNGETAGDVIGRCSGIAATERLMMIGAATPPSGATDTFDRVAANNTATVYVRTELQSGSGSYTTSTATTWARARIYPIL